MAEKPIRIHYFAVYELFRLVEYGHSTELINQNPDAVDEIIRFLNKQLNP